MCNAKAQIYHLHARFFRRKGDKVQVEEWGNAKNIATPTAFINAAVFWVGRPSCCCPSRGNKHTHFANALGGCASAPQEVVFAGAQDSLWRGYVFLNARQTLLVGWLHAQTYNTSCDVLPSSHLAPLKMLHTHNTARDHQVTASCVHNSARADNLDRHWCLGFPSHPLPHRIKKSPGTTLVNYHTQRVVSVSTDSTDFNAAQHILYG